MKFFISIPMNGKSGKQIKKELEQAKRNIIDEYHDVEFIDSFFDDTDLTNPIRFSDEVEYYTPKYIVDKFGPFELDPATVFEKAKEFAVKKFFAEYHDGLSKDWTPYKRIWINPPFTKKKEFLKKAVDTWNTVGNDIYMLLPISFLTSKTFHELVKGAKIYVPNGRIKFENESGELRSPAFGSVIINPHFGNCKRIMPMEDLDGKES